MKLEPGEQPWLTSICFGTAVFLLSTVTIASRSRTTHTTIHLHLIVITTYIHLLPSGISIPIQPSLTTTQSRRWSRYFPQLRHSFSDRRNVQFIHEELHLLYHITTTDVWSFAPFNHGRWPRDLNTYPLTFDSLSPPPPSAPVLVLLAVLFSQQFTRFWPIPHTNSSSVLAELPKMAPRTRRSLALENGPSTNTASVSPSTPDDATSSALPKRGRGRPRKVEIPAESSSSAVSAVDSRSESGEYSTPATSNVVTPVPSTAAKKSSAKVTASQSSKKLEPPTRPPRRQSSRISHAFQSKAEEEDNEQYLNDVSQALDSVGVKDKGKAKPQGKDKQVQTRAAKRKELPPTSDDSDGMDWAPPPKKNKAKGALPNRGSNGEPGSEDEPMAKSRRRCFYGPDTELDAIDDADEALASDYDDYDDYEDEYDDDSEAYQEDGDDVSIGNTASQPIVSQRRPRQKRNRGLPPLNEREKLEFFHPELKTMWDDLKNMPVLKAGKAAQPHAITQQLKPFQLEGLAWMRAMENTKWKGGLLGDEMGLGKTIQAVSLIMSDHPAPNPTLVLVPPVALMQWTAEIEKYTKGALKTLVFHGTNLKAKNMTARELKEFDVLLMSYNTLESTYRKQEKGFKRLEGLCKEKSAIHSLKYHRVILDEAHCIKVSYPGSSLLC